MTLFVFHMVSMSIAFIAMLIAIVIARFFKTKKWWFKAHRILNTIAVVCAVAGFVLAAIFVSSTGGPHIRVSHAVVGIVTLVLLIGMIILGSTMLKVKEKSRIPRLKTLHRHLGRITAVMVIVTIAFGLSFAGIL